MQGSGEVFESAAELWVVSAAWVWRCKERGTGLGVLEDDEQTVIVVYQMECGVYGGVRGRGGAGSGISVD